MPCFAGSTGVLKLALFTSGVLEACLCLVEKRLGQAIEALILGEAHDIAHRIVFAPAQHPPTAKATVTAKDDSHLRPGLAQSLNQ